ncbi:hypothetical protein HY990_02215 [Candidatus Micrarchaeota archaeon]|nr:hypothetical protein [Candidatus Micrarchaeota archaeon]
MAIETCELTGTQSAKLVKCNYCSKKICMAAVKSQKRKEVGIRYICKTCWCSMAKRGAYKSAK